MKSLTSILFSLFLFGCGSGDDKTMQEYNIQVIDGITENPISGVEVELFWNFGINLDQDSGLTDQEGMVRLNTAVDVDSLETLINQDPNLDERNISQIVSIMEDDLFFYELFQDTAIQIIHSRLREDDLITAKTYMSKVIDYRMIDTPPRRDRDIIFGYVLKQFHPNFSFEDYGGTINVFTNTASDTMNQLLFLSDDVDYRMDYYLISQDTMLQTLDTFLRNSLEFDLEMLGPDQILEITF